MNRNKYKAEEIQGKRLQTTPIEFSILSSDQPVIRFKSKVHIYYLEPLLHKSPELFQFFSKRTPSGIRKKKVLEGEDCPNDEKSRFVEISNKGPPNNNKNIILEHKLRQLKVPRPPSDDDKELYSIIARDVFTNGCSSEEDSKTITLANVIGLVRLFFLIFHVSILHNILCR